jgi:membrane protein YqaA with SNARE-associated domain
MILVPVVPVRSIKNVMEWSADFIQALQNVVLHPDLGSALTLLVVSIVNEILSVVPYAIILYGQLFFIKEAFSVDLATKLFLYVAIPVGVGSTIGSLPFYLLSYFGGKPAIEKFGRYVRLSWLQVERVAIKFKGSWYDEVIFLALRAAPFMPALPVSIAGGILRMRPSSFILLTLAGFVIRMVIMFAFVGISVEAIAGW